MNDYIIEIDGVEITWFKNFIESGCKKIALRFSGGVESSLVLWLLCYFLDKAKIYDVEIYNYYLRDCKKKIKSKTEPLKEIINLIQNEFPKIDLKPLDVTVYWSNLMLLEPNAQKTEKRLYEKYNVEWFINGLNLNHTEEEYIKLSMPKEVYDTRDEKRDPSRMLFDIDTHDNVKKRSPLYQCTKSTVKKIYEKYNLIERLYPKTISCMADFPPFPCKTCYWCVEKYAVFGSYDNLLQ